MADVFFKIPPSDDFRENSIQTIIDELGQLREGVPEFSLLRRALTLMCKGEIEDSLHALFEAERRGNISLTVESLGVKAFEGSWEILEAITPEGRICENCGRYTDKTALFSIDNDLMHEGFGDFSELWDLFERCTETGQGYKTEAVDVICEGCRDDMKEVAEKMEVISDRIFKEYTERLNDEDWYFNDPLYDAFHSERTKEWSPLLSQVPVPWKFREESENAQV